MWRPIYQQSMNMLNNSNRCVIKKNEIKYCNWICCNVGRSALEAALHAMEHVHQSQVVNLQRRRRTLKMQVRMVACNHRRLIPEPTAIRTHLRLERSDNIWLKTWIQPRHVNRAVGVSKNNSNKIQNANQLTSSSSLPYHWLNRSTIGEGPKWLGNYFKNVYFITSHTNMDERTHGD